MNCTIDEFTPSGTLCYINQHGDILQQASLKEVFNLRCYIQHLKDQSEDEDENPLSQQNGMKQTSWKFIKNSIHHRHSMTPEQRFEEIFKKQQEKLDTEEGESNKDEEENFTSSDIPEQDSESDTAVDDAEESNITQTLQVHHGMNETAQDEQNSSEAEDDTLEMKMWLKCKHMKRIGSKTMNKIRNS